MSAPRREDADRVTATHAYAQRFAGPVGAYFLHVQTARTLELAAPWPGARVLDVGGGHAQLAGPLIAAGCQVTVAGSGPSCETLLKESLEPGSYQFVSCDLMDLPFEPRSFDLVLSYRMLTHVADPAGFAAQLCRTADKAVIVDYPAKRSFNILGESLFKAKESLDDNVHTRRYASFWDREVEGLFTARGFGRPARRRQHFWPMALHRAVGKAGFTSAAEGLALGMGLTALLGSPVILRMERAA
ncbi:MAG: class I SAM-dependent methyltransferase [Desulfarculaceae bacterium]|nr:class I SAM-dependent methyltransferase [Desulfarculaceae bacterium]MCF8072761.1 class I SAM-dependent methyltransferase [Desulfarculaceae bacterium]MCF8100929.1 class I SAM-dependent methyltransferase [Desulfarculaceae bacterium]MCF8117587.1 class I SAM-dependent methyltransferase [Desulfarculaceae bacterium]